MLWIYITLLLLTTYAWGKGFLALAFYGTWAPTLFVLWPSGFDPPTTEFGRVVFFAALIPGWIDASVWAPALLLVLVGVSWIKRRVYERQAG